MKKDSDDKNDHFNIAELTDFQFGPAWARQGEKPSGATQQYKGDNTARRERPRRREGDSSDRPQRSRAPQRNRDASDSRSERGERGFKPRGSFSRSPRPERVLPPRPEPTEGLRVELRPANNILEIISQQVQKNKRVVPLMKLASLTLAGAERCDLVLMKLENDLTLIRSQKGDLVCWLTEAEALQYLWIAPWFAEYYTEESVQVEAPKGNFTAIAVCKLGKECIGPVNWHGYQAALTKLYKNKYSKRMSIEDFRKEVFVDKSEETLERWQNQASQAKIWKPTRAEAQETVLPDIKSVEADFLAHHYNEVYVVEDKVFINGATPQDLLSPGLAAHLRIQLDRARRYPQMIIPNLCHGLARHHMPIFKWHKHHYTGPSRIRVIPTDVVLADRMKSIIDWVKENSGQKVDALFTALTGVAAGADEESIALASAAHAPYTADLIWLLDQGYLVVTDDNAIWYPKGEIAPSPEPVQDKRQPRKNSRGPRNRAAKKPAAARDQKPAAAAAPSAESTPPPAAKTEDHTKEPPMPEPSEAPAPVEESPASPQD